MKNLESLHQQKFFEWIEWVGIKHTPELKYCFHIPNGEKRHISVGVKLKKMGVKRGPWDIFFALARHGFSGLFIEFKKDESSKLSEHQIEFKAFFESQNFCCKEARSGEEGINIIKWYIGYV